MDVQVLASRRAYKFYKCVKIGKNERASVTYHHHHRLFQIMEP